MTIIASDPTIILIPGHWLGAWAWDEVVESLTALGRRAIPVTLPGLDGLDPERTTRTLSDQVAAIEKVMGQVAASAEQPVVIVAHSGANAPVSVVLDHHPEVMGRVVWVDSGPVAPGTVFAPDASDDLVELPLPPFDVLGEQASLEGLSARVLERFRARAVPEPGPVLREPVRLTNGARLQVPTTLVCCSIPSAQLMELASAGHPMFAEVANLHSLDLIDLIDLIDLPTGHWPMWSRPDELAQILATASTSPAS